MIQIVVFLIITVFIAGATYWHCRGKGAAANGDEREYFLAGSGLSWYFVAGSITLTNLSTEQLVGMNGGQMALLAWWELAAVVGLLILTFVFLPVYYRNDCTTTTELLQKKYGDKHIRALISILFLLGNIFIILPAVLYGGSLFLLSVSGLDSSLASILTVSAVLAVVGAAYAIFGGLRAVAVSDTYSGVLVLGLALLLVVLALSAIDFDLTGVPTERLTMIGSNQSAIPWHTLLTGMIFIQTFYWSTNQTITQRAMAAPTLREAQKGVLAAAGIRLLIVPVIVVVPGIVSYKLFGDVGDAAYGLIVAEVLPSWLSGAFAAALFAAVLTTFNSILNASAALYVCDLHRPYVGEGTGVAKLGALVSVAMSILAIGLVPFFASQESLINTVQELYGLLSMPILSAFIVGILFTNVRAGAAMIGVVLGVLFYGYFSMVWQPLHYIHGMFATLILSVAAALISNLLLFGQKAQFATRNREPNLGETPGQTAQT